MSEIHERIFNMIPDVQLAHIIDELATKITELNERIKRVESKMDRTGR